MNKLVIFFSFIITLYTNCSFSGNKCCNENDQILYLAHSSNYKIDSSEFDISFFLKKISQTGYYANFGFHFLKRDTAFFISYLSSQKDTLFFINLFDSTSIFRSGISEIFPKEKRLSCKIFNDTIHLIDPSSLVYTRYSIDSAFSLKKISAMRFFDTLNFKKRFIASNILINQKIAFEYPYLLIPFGRFDKRNGMDKKAILKFNISSQKTEFVLDYPQKYNECYVREGYPIIDTRENYLISVFLKDDEISITNLKNNKLEKKTGNHDFNNNYMCYTDKNEENLAYTSKYDLNDEQNFSLLFNNQKLFLIKRLRKNDKKEPPKSAILIYDLELKHKFTFFPSEYLTPRLAFAYKNGVALISHDWSKLYYYDFSVI